MPKLSAENWTQYFWLLKQLQFYKNKSKIYKKTPNLEEDITYSGIRPIIARAFFGSS